MIGFFVISTHLGGAEKSLLDLLAELKNERDSFQVVLPKNEGPLIEELKRLEIHYQELLMPSWFLKISRKNFKYFLMYLPLAIPYLLYYFFKLHYWIKKNNLKTVHTTGLKYHLILGFYTYMTSKITLIIHVRDIISNPWLKRIFNFLSQSKKIKWISNSKVTAEALSPIESEVIYNGFPPLREADQKDLRKELSLPKDCFLIGIVGVIARWKGQREFLLMAQKLVELGYDNFHFLVVGDEIYDTLGEKGELQHLRRTAQDFCLYSNIHFLGFQKNITNVYSQLNVLVHSSLAPEPFGRVIVEAMQNQCPVTASALGGPLEIINPEKNGWLHEPGNIQSMAGQVLDIYKNPKQAQEKTKTAASDTERFSMSKHVQKMKSILDL